MNRQQLQERLQKLQALAADQVGTPEGATAERLARELVVRLARLGTLDGYEDEPVERRKLLLADRCRWRRRLFFAVARHCNCVAAFGDSGLDGTLFGHRSSLDVACYLFAVAGRQIVRARDESLGPRPEDGAEWARRSDAFCSCAVLALENRFRERLAHEACEDQTLPVLLSHRARQVDEWVDGQGIRFKRMPSAVHGYSQEGYETGRRVELRSGVRHRGWKRRLVGALD